MGNRFITLALAVTLLSVSACAAVQEKAGEFDLDLDTILDEVRDCDKLVDRLVAAIQTAADAADELAEANEGLVPDIEIREIVDKIAVNRWFALAERLGCLKLEMELEVLDHIEDIAPHSPAGRELIEELERQLNAG